MRGGTGWIDRLFPIAMQRKTQMMKRRREAEPPGRNAGWRAFAVGMIGMSALIAVWIVLFETAEAPDADSDPAGRPQMTAEQSRARPEAD